MKTLILTLTLFVLLNYTSAEDQAKWPETCPEIDNEFINSIFGFFGRNPDHKKTKFYLGVKDGEYIKIGRKNDWSALESEAFNPSRKTVIIIHGYKSDAKKPWIRALRDALLDKEDVNIIIVSWKQSSYRFNMASSVRVSHQVAEHVFQFLQTVKSKINANEKSEVQWNKLYFIGRDIGAHISGQVGFLLKEDDASFKVERITGLDPAKPCFVQAEDRYRLDKTDADFVDIIHTQTGNKDEKFSLGIRGAYGHMDFYVNGGVLQPGCHSSSWIKSEFDDVNCSHRLAKQYFIESVVNSKSGTCKFVAHPWDRTYEGAVKILNEFHSRKSCDDCAEMGYDAPKSKKTGAFLVFTSSKEPYCELRFSEDIPRIREMLEYLKPYVPKTSVPTPVSMPVSEPVSEPVPTTVSTPVPE